MLKKLILNVSVFAVIALAFTGCCCANRCKVPSTETKTTQTIIDPICNMEVDTLNSFKGEYNGKNYYFCSELCKENFLKEPEKYIGK